MGPRALPAAATGVGAAAITCCAAAALSAGEPAALVPVLLAVGWWAAGLLALVARPDFASARLLTAFGLLHLSGFAVSSATSAWGSGVGWTPWLAAVVANALYDLGFAALAVLLATFPTARVRRPAIALLAAVSAVVVALTAGLTTSPVDLPLLVGGRDVRPPAPLPVGTPVDLAPLLPLMVVVALAVLVWRTLRASGDERRRLLWPATVTAVLAMLLVATPAGTHLLGRGWALVFVPIAFGLPFALVAGIRRFRLLDVELYAARSLAYAAVVLLVVCVYALAAVVIGRRSVGAAVVVAVVAALTGRPVQAWLEARVDRLLSGGRVQGHALLRQLAESLETVDAQRIAGRTAGTVVTGLDAGWAEVTMSGLVVRAGAPGHAPAQVTVPLLANGEVVGRLTCGPRRGGWADDDVRLLELLGRHAGLALRGAELGAALALQVEQLSASRERLVRAEDDARRRIERDLHDGVQQQVVVLLGRLGLLRAQLEGDPALHDLATQSHALAQAVLEDLRHVVRGIHPPLLTDRGLVAAVEAQADLLTVPVSVDVDPRLERQRFAADVETVAYYVVSEAVTNVIKHSGAQRARVVLTPYDAAGLQVAVVDEGQGFDPAGDHSGSGLRGLRDRVEAVGGRLEVTSAAGVGTTVVARFPQRVLAGA